MKFYIFAKTKTIKKNIYIFTEIKTEMFDICMDHLHI